MKSHVLFRSHNSQTLFKNWQRAIVAALCAFGVSSAHAACGHADNFSYNYPAYSATWTQDQCEQYAASGIGHCYSFGGDGGWGGSIDGVDCSAYCARVWAIPGHIAQATTGAHPYSTYSWYPSDGSMPTPPAHTHFVTVNDITDIQPYDCFVLNANFGTPWHSPHGLDRKHRLCRRHHLYARSELLHLTDQRVRWSRWYS